MEACLASQAMAIIKQNMSTAQHTLNIERVDL